MPDNKLVKTIVDAATLTGLAAAKQTFFFCLMTSVAAKFRNTHRLLLMLPAFTKRLSV